MAIDTNEQGVVSRSLPAPSVDNSSATIRLGRYRGTYVYNVVPKNYPVADEGSYFVSNNSGTGSCSLASTTRTPLVIDDERPNTLAAILSAAGEITLIGACENR